MDIICHVRTGFEVDASTLTQCTDSTPVDQTVAECQRAHIEIMACRSQDTYKGMAGAAASMAYSASDARNNGGSKDEMSVVVNLFYKPGGSRLNLP